MIPQRTWHTAQEKHTCQHWLGAVLNLNFFLCLDIVYNSRVEPSGCLFVPFSIESYRLLGVPAMKLLHDLGDAAASLGTNLTRARLVAGALRELSVGLRRGNCAMYRASTVSLARVTCWSFRTSMVSPLDEVV
jgi:hypothetical protein